MMLYSILKWVLAALCGSVGLIAIAAPSPYPGTSVFGVFLVLLAISLVPKVKAWLWSQFVKVLTGPHKAIAWSVLVIGGMAWIGGIYEQDLKRRAPSEPIVVSNKEQESREPTAIQIQNQNECKKIIRAFLQMQTDLEITGFAYKFYKVANEHGDEPTGGCRQLAYGLSVLKQPYEGTSIAPADIEFALRKVGNARSLLGE